MAKSVFHFRIIYNVKDTILDSSEVGIWEPCGNLLIPDDQNHYFGFGALARDALGLVTPGTALGNLLLVVFRGIISDALGQPGTR